MRAASSGERRSGRITLIATSRRKSVSVARYTSPIPPLPTRTKSAYRLGTATDIGAIVPHAAREGCVTHQ